MQMAAAIESPTFQSAFNVVKGSAPARTDVPNDAFDACGKKAIKRSGRSQQANGTLYGSMAHGHAAPAAVKNAIYDVVTAQFNGEYRFRGRGRRNWSPRSQRRSSSIGSRASPGSGSGRGSRRAARA